MKPYAVLFGLLLAVPLGTARAQDIHAVFEERCLECHGHMGPFVEDHLRLENDVLTGAATPDLAAFLRQHEGGLNTDELAVFLQTAEQQIRAEGFFRERCALCHDRARVFVRKKMIVKDGMLVDRYSGRNIGMFMRGHARITPEEAARLIEAFLAIREGGR
ncbi:hypothetical protein [Aestuariicoccus sp. MJ-SS9]|uniref:hypothetical protein n=1 Tax=Aestuariicoccus sp. MJ-SS9 TaxID=3079855 RepID=UPI00290DCACA|nr:hypothetical protein [Aestuariicoccus sp. MJ-SS9]MDU8911613.1 hypothetical protein [Aestuariicoccus sp. MJ-SS9]